MLEFIKEELYAIEETEYSRGQLINFFLNGHRNTMVALYRNGIFNRLITYPSLIHNETLSETVVTLGPNILSDAMQIFSIATNRIKLLPVVDENGVLLSIMRWNNQIKENSKPIQPISEIEEAETIYINEYSDNIMCWVENYLATHSGKTLILEGEGWEVMQYGNLINAYSNFIFPATEDTDIETAYRISFRPEKRKMNNYDIRSMWQLKDCYKPYRVFVGPCNVEGVKLLTMLTIIGVEVAGIWDYRDITEPVFNKKVVPLTDLILDEDVIIVSRELEVNNRLQDAYSESKARFVAYCNLLEYSECLRKKDIVIVYDSNKALKKLVQDLTKEGYDVEAVCPLGIKKKAYDINVEKILDISEVLSNNEMYNIILATDSYEENMIEQMGCNDIEVYYSNRMLIPGLKVECFFNIDKALKHDKKIVLYGVDSCYTNVWIKFLDMLDVHLYKIVDDYDDNVSGIENIYNLAFENTEDLYLIINKKIGDWNDACILTRDLGFDEDYSCGIGLYPISARLSEYVNDVIIGYSVDYELLPDLNYPGFKIYGEADKDAYKIMVLGGSTTTGFRYIPSWAELLYKRLKSEGYNIVIYNGGVCGYTSSQELFKLIRDGSAIKPDMVISFSGVNNIMINEYPYISEHSLNLFASICGNDYAKGLKRVDSSTAEVWLEQEHMMAVITENVCGARFYAFAQPQYYAKDYLTDSERLQFELRENHREKAIKHRDDISRIAHKYDWLMDIQHILDNKPEVFYDSMHVIEEGNQIIADEIYKHIIKDIEASVPRNNNH